MNRIIRSSVCAALLCVSAVGSLANADPIRVTKVEWCLHDAMVPSVPVMSAVSQWNLDCLGKKSCDIMYDIMEFRRFLGGDCHDGSPKALGVWYNCMDYGVILKEKYYEVGFGRDHVLMTLNCP